MPHDLAVKTAAKASDDTSLVRSSLGSSSYLACLSGPDCGAVIPLRNRQLLGRQVGLEDPYTSYRHAVIVKSGGGFSLKDLGAKNPVNGSKRPRKLKVGVVFRVGMNKWHVRSRPLTPTWDLNDMGPGFGSRKWFLRMGLRLLLPLILISTLFRFVGLWWTLGVLGIATVVGITALFRSRASKQRFWHPSTLALAVAARHIANIHDISWDSPPRSDSTVKVLLEPGKSKVLKIPSHGFCAVTGAFALQYAHWIGAQVHAQGLNVQVVPFEESDPLNGHKAEFEGLDLKVLWSNAVDGIGDVVPTVIPSRFVAGKLWLANVCELLKHQSDAGPPDSCTLADLLGPLDEASIRSLWEEEGEGPRSWLVPIGMDETGVATIDLVNDGPHALVVGGTGSGKSEFLATMVLSMALARSPRDLRFVFIDYKGGAGLEHLRHIPHVEHSLTDLDGDQTPWLLRSIRALMNTRKVDCLKHGFKGVEDWRQSWESAGRNSSFVPSPPPRVVIVADEVRALADQHPNLLQELVLVARQGRSLGVHLVAASQRLGGAITSDLRSVIDLRIGLRCLEISDSVEALGTPKAALLPRIPGRAVIEDKTIQCALSTETTQLIEDICAAEQHLGAKGWTRSKELADPLPTSIKIDTVTSMTDKVGPENKNLYIGLHEDPTSCQVKPLSWSREPLLLVGPPNTRTDLHLAAQAIAQVIQSKQENNSHATFWIGSTPPPAQIIADLTPIPGVFQGESARGNEPSPGYLAHAISEIVRQVRQDKTATVIFPDISDTLSFIDIGCGPEHSKYLMQQVFSAAQTGRLTLLATETKPRSDSRRFACILVRVPSTRDAQHPELAQFLPPRDTTNPTSSVEHWAVQAPYRFLAHGFNAHPSLALLPEPKTVANPDSGTSKSWALDLARTVNNRESLSAILLPNPGDTTSDQCAEVQLVLDPALNLDALKEDLRRVVGQNNVKEISSSNWPMLQISKTKVTLAVQPSREVVRQLCNSFPSEAPWALASIPFPPGEGLIVAYDSLRRLKLGRNYLDVTGRT